MYSIIDIELLSIFHRLRKNQNSPRSPSKNHHSSDHAAELKQLQLELPRAINPLSKLPMKAAKHQSKLAQDTSSNLTSPVPMDFNYL
jgi:hypothetical protein